MLTYSILIIDDEQIVCNSLTRLLRRKDWRIFSAQSGDEAKRFMHQMSFDVVIVDYKLGDTNGMEITEFIKHHFPETVVVMLTAFGNVDLAVNAIKKGAFDFLQKEGDPQLTLHIVERAVENVKLRKEVQHLRDERVKNGLQTTIITESPKMKEVLKMVDEFAKTDATILLEGETGTGKSIVAEYIHYSSERHSGPFVTINCGAIPRELIESELFGYEHGAFTGAKSEGKIGLIKRADGGTLFLDEIGDLALELQSKLLYVLEKGEFLSIGAVETTKVDVRFIAATNVALEEQMRLQKFRSDLYYRLNVASIKIPALRDRKEDILPFTKTFVHTLNQKLGKFVHKISSEAEQFLLSYPWPGNVRELRNAIERVMLLKKNQEITDSDFTFLTGQNRNHFDKDVCRVEIKFQSSDNIINDVIKQVVMHAWECADHNQTRAASLLSIPRTTMQSYLQKYHLI